MSRPGSRFHARLSSARWERVRRLELERAGWRCESCGAVASEVHHKRPMHKGGAAWAAVQSGGLVSGLPYQGTPEAFESC